MKELLIILVAVTWWITGHLSFIYWWTKDHHYRTSDIPLALFCGIAGPFNIIGGYFIHGNNRIIKQKKD